jgi:HK97 family phage major capsid protein|nr:MAG TPA_asm: major capsid protein [Caudoviricetes sp.]
MNKKLIELRRNLTAKLKEARELIDEGKIEEGQKATKEAQEIKDQIVLEEQMVELEDTIKDDNKIVDVEDRSTKKKVESRTALVHYLQGKKLTAEERTLLVETTTPGEGQNSMAVIVPQDIYTEINELKRQYKSLKQYTDVQSTGTNSGSFVFEPGDSIEPFVDVDEGTEIGELTSPNLRQQKFAITDKGGILPISNTLLSDEAGGLMKYIMKWIARKSTVTDNVKILSVLNGHGIKIKASTPDEVKSAMNTKLDPELLSTAVIITNQNGFDIMDNWKDAVGRPILQDHPTEKTKKTLGGVTIEVFANRTIKDVDGASPVYIGNLEEAIKFMDREQLAIAVSTEAGFTKNLTLVRALQRDDVEPKDLEAYLNISLTAPKEQPVVHVKNVTTTENKVTNTTPVEDTSQSEQTNTGEE